MNLTQAGLSTSFSLDAVNRQLSNNATSNVSFDPTSRARVSAHETDKQSEDNATWYFEYRALLNSKLTTLITSLTSAYTTDLDASMGKTSLDNNSTTIPWGGKNAMQGLTGSLPAVSAIGDRPRIDPGATRTTVAYLSGFKDPAAGTQVNGFAVSTTESNQPWSGDGSNVSDQTASVTLIYNTGTPDVTKVTGTTTFMSGGGTDFMLDNLNVNMDPYSFPPVVDNSLPAGMGVGQAKYNYFDNNKLAELSSYDRDSTTVSDPVRLGRNIGNNLEFTLYKFFERPENLDLIRFGFFRDVYVVGTSSLPTGSQIQGSLSMDWDQINGKIKIKQERYAAFFHS